MLKVVIVDDEKMICSLISQLLDWEELGAKIVGMAYTGTEALEMIQEQRPDIIISDIRMPGYDGLELIKRTKEAGIESEFVMISGFKQFEYAQNAMKYGVKYYLLKPIEEDKLTEIIKEIAENIACRKARKNHEMRIEQELQETRDKMKKRFLTSILSNEESREETVDQLLVNEEYNTTFKEGAFQAVFIKLDTDKEMEVIGLDGSGRQEIYAILSGKEKIDEGEIWFDNRLYHQYEELPVEQANGLFFIGNYDLIIPDMTIAENLYIIEKINYLQFCVSKKKMELQAKKLFAKFGVDIHPGKLARNMTRYESCLLRFMRAYVRRAKLIVIDDIFDDRSYDKSSQLIEIMNLFKQEGISILWMNSYPDVITENADKTVVICNGQTRRIFYKNEISRYRVLECLTGKSTLKSIKKEKIEDSQIVFRAENITNHYFQKMSFYCKKGEILGIYDMRNKFSREWYRLLLGKRIYDGEIYVGEKK